MREAWRALVFADCDQAAKRRRDPVAPAMRTAAAMKKKKVSTRTLEDSSPVHSFQTLMQDLQTIVRTTCRTLQNVCDAPHFEITTTATPAQKRARELIGQIKV